MTAFLFDPSLAAMRFGIGLSPRYPAPQSVAEMMQAATGPDRAGAAFPIPGLDALEPSHADFLNASRARRDGRGTPQQDQTIAAFQQVRKDMNVNQRNMHLASIARAVDSGDGLRERLTMFWANHFTVVGKNFALRTFVSSYIEDAIRPHATGRFADMVIAATLHPVMLTYLDQTTSIGPASAVGERTGRGLNENLARELLELHLMGVDADYDQDDVRQLAELLTGLRYDGRGGFSFDPKRAEPGAEIVVGRRYWAGADLTTVTSALRDLTRQPAVARHVAHKLAVHFVSPDPDPSLVDTLADTFRDTDGDLAQVTEALLNHPASWRPEGRNVRRPDLFLAASIRALGLTGTQVMDMRPKTYRNWIIDPLKIMGQPFQSPIGPDGWPDDAAHWITPQGLAGRITWSMGAPSILLRSLPDPRDFVLTALGPQAPQDVIFAASAAEARADGVGVILSSPAFQRI